VSAITPVGPAPGHSPVLGPFSVNISGLVAGSSTDMELLAPRSSAANDVLTFDGANWNVTPSTITGTDVVVHLVDGGLGDSDGLADGTIRFVGATFAGDITPPAVVCAAPAPQFLLNQLSARLSASVSDSDSGVASAVVNVPVSTSVIGSQLVLVSASDLAGNVGTAQCPYVVGVKLDRLISPSTSVTTRVAANRPVSIRWRVVDFNGAPVSAASNFLGMELSASSCARGRTDSIDSVRDRGLRYLGNGRWEYDWRAPPSRGCYTLRLNLVGASQDTRIRVN
jgi:hypothetical protein